MKLVEKFVSINGESCRAGELAVFLRFKGCNLSCSYCDTFWANEGDCPYEEWSPEALIEAVRDAGINNVTLTGGEPLLQKDMGELLRLFAIRLPDVRVEVETNGSIDLSPFCKEYRPVFTMDYKLPSSGCEEKMLLENFKLLQKGDAVKFVSGSREDLERAKNIIDRYHLTEHCQVYLSPVFGKIEPEDMVQYMMEHKMNGVRLQIQMHKVIWDPNKRGV